MHKIRLSLFSLFLALGTLALQAEVIFTESFSGSGPVEGTTADTNRGNEGAAWVTVNSEDGSLDSGWVETDGVLTWEDQDGVRPNEFSNRNYIPIRLGGAESFVFVARAIPGAQQTAYIGLARDSKYLSQRGSAGFAVALLSGDALFQYFDGKGEQTVGRQSLGGSRNDPVEIRIAYDGEQGTVGAEAENLSTGTKVVLAEDIPVEGWSPTEELTFVQWQSNKPMDDAPRYAVPALDHIEVSVEK